MERIVALGKVGIGKSTVSANLAAAYALADQRVLLVGCDPKHDVTRSIAPGIEPFMDQVLRRRQEGSIPRFSADELCTRGRLGIDCVEAGGPEPGVGCAGRGISLMLETFESSGLLDGDAYDVCLFDVLGDVVCGGFAAPLRQGFGEKVLVVVSEELMSLYAANNIARAVRAYADNGVVLAGLVANLHGEPGSHELVARFAAALGTRVLVHLPRDPAVREAEMTSNTTAVELHPDAPFSLALRELADRLGELATDGTAPPTPLPDSAFFSGEPDWIGGRP